VLRAECTIYNPQDFRVFRPTETDSFKAWRPLRYGVADLYRHAEVCQAANERYLDALAAIPDTTPLRVLVDPLCRPVIEPRKVRAPATTGSGPERRADPEPDTAAANQAPPATPAGSGNDWPSATPAADDPAALTATGPESPSPVPVQAALRGRARRLRALNPLSEDDANLLEAVGRPEFLINGLRNRDLRRLLYPTGPKDKTQERRRSAAVSRKLRLLRGHSLLQKVPKTHRYLVSPHGRTVITALLAARDANTDFLTSNAA
jgi:hypothetical protein